MQCSTRTVPLSKITYEKLTEKHLKRLLAVYEGEPVTIHTNISPLSKKVGKTADCTYTAYIYLAYFLEHQEIQTQADYVLQNDSYTIFADTGNTDTVNPSWSVTVQTTHTAKPDIDGHSIQKQTMPCR